MEPHIYPSAGRHRTRNAPHEPTHRSPPHQHHYTLAYLCRSTFTSKRGTVSRRLPHPDLILHRMQHGLNSLYGHGEVSRYGREWRCAGGRCSALSSRSTQCIYRLKTSERYAMFAILDTANILLTMGMLLHHHYPSDHRAPVVQHPRLRRIV